MKGKMMSIENLLAELTAAIRENTAALHAARAGISVTTIEPKAELKTEKPKATPAETKVETKAEPAGLDYATDVKPLVIQYASKHGKPKLMDLLATFGTDSALKFAETCTAQELVNLYNALQKDPA